MKVKARVVYCIRFYLFTLIFLMEILNISNFKVIDSSSVLVLYLTNVFFFFGFLFRQIIFLRIFAKFCHIAKTTWN